MAAAHVLQRLLSRRLQADEPRREQDPLDVPVQHDALTFPGDVLRLGVLQHAVEHAARPAVSGHRLPPQGLQAGGQREQGRHPERLLFGADGDRVEPARVHLGPERGGVWRLLEGPVISRRLLQHGSCACRHRHLRDSSAHGAST
eukprot:1968503-Pleurochrysis_carterae.AAC.1